MLQLGFLSFFYNTFPLSDSNYIDYLFFYKLCFIVKINPLFDTEGIKQYYSYGFCFIRYIIKLNFTGLVDCLLIDGEDG